MTDTTLKSRTTARAEDTRRKIYEAAMELFREKGFDETTMRDIAAKAGVALGGAYYYFSSKDAIVLAFYREMQETSNAVVLEALGGHKKLKERIRCVLDKRMELLVPNRKFCSALFRHAPDGSATRFLPSATSRDPSATPPLSTCESHSKAAMRKSPPT
jgi:AcrR family transcriptional regulator